MFNKRKAERELLYAEINRLKKINSKLADENRRLRSSMGDIEKYREKYSQIVQSMEMIKKQYAEKLKDFNGIEALYRKEYRKLKSESGKMNRDVLGSNDDCILVKGAVRRQCLWKIEDECRKRNRKLLWGLSFLSIWTYF